MMKFATMFACIALAGCASYGSQSETVTEPAKSGVLSKLHQCKARLGDKFIGREASQKTGTELFALSNARTFRWGPPGGKLTRDMRPDRLTVSYDENMKITHVTCG